MLSQLKCFLAKIECSDVLQHEGFCRPNDGPPSQTCFTSALFTTKNRRWLKRWMSCGLMPFIEVNRASSSFVLICAKTKSVSDGAQGAQDGAESCLISCTCAFKPGRDNWFRAHLGVIKHVQDCSHSIEESLDHMP